eukprot:UN25944
MGRLQKVLEILQQKKINIPVNQHEHIWKFAEEESLLSLCLNSLDKLILHERVTEYHFTQTLLLCLRSGAMNETVFLMKQMFSLQYSIKKELCEEVLKTSLSMGHTELVQISYKELQKFNHNVSLDIAEQLIPFWSKLGYIDESYD